jgi:hypothetical protein
MHKRFIKVLAVSALASSVLFLGTAEAQEGFAGEGSGTATVTFHDGGHAEISVDWQGLAPEIPDLSGTPYEALSNMPFPHAQHIHAGGEGRCPAPAADADGNGVIDTPEGLDAYGPVVVSLTEEPGDTAPGATLDVENFPAGGSASYSRGVELDVDAETDAGTFNPAEQVRSGNAVVVVHGLNPAIMPGDSALEESPLNAMAPDLELPLAATAPALCGVLTDTGDGTFTAQLRPNNPVAAQADQVDPMPAPGVDTGGGSTAPSGQPAWLFVLGALSVAGAAALVLTAANRRWAGES